MKPVTIHKSSQIEFLIIKKDMDGCGATIVLSCDSLSCDKTVFSEQALDAYKSPSKNAWKIIVLWHLKIALGGVRKLDLRQLWSNILDAWVDGGRRSEFEAIIRMDDTWRGVQNALFKIAMKQCLMLDDAWWRLMIVELLLQFRKQTKIILNVWRLNDQPRMHYDMRWRQILKLWDVCAGREKFEWPG